MQLLVKSLTPTKILQEQLAQVVDDKIRDADIMRRQIIGNDSLNNFLLSNKPYCNIQRYNIHLVMKDFIQYMGTNQVVEDFYVYTHTTGDIISTKISV